MRYRKGQITLFIVSVILGFVISVLIHNIEGSGATSVSESTSIDMMYRLLEKEKLELEKAEEYKLRIAELEKQIEQFQNRASSLDLAAGSIQKDLMTARLLAGLMDLEGPGVEIVLNDRKKETLPILGEGEDINWYLVHDEDVLRVVNELAAAGAEAISINDIRVVSNTRIRCGGPTINVKDRPLAPPFYIRAIGDPDKLLNHIIHPASDPNRHTSIYDELTSYGIEFSIQKKDLIHIPRFYGVLDFNYANPLQEQDGGE